ncbi:hypothetical protein ATANTOWER_013844 [Ataeniobius toweri]|uniref:Uncharacterized protein n=1 Tax=Ataeniobius toweri TaxID=208326 RepID=A0ABU7C2N1_9TELE|nr:hypothetical protein [Ataeniobius toweri]
MHIGIWQKSEMEVLPTTATPGSLTQPSPPSPMMGILGVRNTGVRVCSFPPTASPIRFPVVWSGWGSPSPDAQGSHSPSTDAAAALAVSANVSLGVLSDPLLVQ